MKIGFFEESEGNKSMTRLISFVFAIYSVVASGYVFYKYGPTEGIATFSAISALSFGGKLIQKQMENKPEK